MKVTEKKDSVIIDGVKSFSAKHTFLCGQCFRWSKEADESFTGVAFSKPVNISCKGERLIIQNITRLDFESQWKHYLDLDTDYEKIKNTLALDAQIQKAMQFGWGIRILNQEIFECLLSFIISTQSTIPRIQKTVEKLSKQFGTKIYFADRAFYTFPTCEQLFGIQSDDLSEIKAGYRADYIVDAVNKVHSKEVDLSAIVFMPYAQAKAELMKIKGVGPKVADCVLLFSGGKKEAFPIDVWVQRVVKSLYLGQEATLKQIESFAARYFGKYAGAAQQYLFYYARENKIS